MAAQKDPKPLSEGKLNYLSTNDHIVSKKQITHDAKNEAESIADTMALKSYWFDFFVTARTIWFMDEYSEDHFIWHQAGFLRDGYLNRVYGNVYPIDTPSLPAEPYKEIVHKTFPQLRMYDDVTGQKLLKLTAGLDYEYGRASEAFFDMSNYEEFVNLHTMKVGESLGKQIELLSSVYAMSHFPCSTLSSNPDLVGFLDQNLRPEEQKSPGAYKWFDKDGNFWKEFCLKEVAGQSQEKLTNIGYYSVKIWNWNTDEVELSRSTAPTASSPDNTTKTIFFQKKNNKQYTKQDITPFACIYALTNAIREKWISMTRFAVPQNMGMYKPFQTQAQTASQLARKTSPQNLEIILNPYDWSKIQQNWTSTSPSGNLVATLDDIVKAGTKVYVKESMLPGQFIIQERYTYMVIKVLEQTYEQPFDFCLSIQRGAHMFCKIFISGLTCFYKGIPLSYIPAQEYISNNFKALEAS